MSERWPGGIVRSTPVTPAGPLQSGAASGVWSLADAAYWTKQGLWPLAGNFLAVEDVFSTYLYTGNGETQTITNGIDLAGKGGLLWIKNRSAATNNIISDTVRGAGNFLMSNSTSQQFFNTDNVSALSSTGFSVGVDSNTNGTAGNLYASWTFRKAPKFFDVVTYTGDGTASQTISHNLGIAPGCVIIKRTNGTSDWPVYHRGNEFAPQEGLALNQTSGTGSAYRSLNSAPTATTFTVGAGVNPVNVNGATYVAYLYAHDATSDGIIQCGSYTGNGSSNGPEVNLGWEPQWLLIKNASGSGRNWLLFDNMRGMVVGSADAYLVPNSAGAEASFNYLSPTATGFQITATDGSVNNNGQTFIYIAIRRGPMRTPTLGTSVYAPFATSLAVDTAITTNFPVDLMISGQRNGNNATDNWAFIDRLRGATASNNTSSTPQKRIKSTSLNAEDNPTYPYAYNWWNTGLVQGYGLAGASQIYYTLRRAPGFFDEVCYTGNGTPGGGGTRAINHNLGVAPEFVIVKSRSGAYGWTCYYPASNIGLLLNGTNPSFTPDFTGVSATTFTVIDFNSTNASGQTYVAYLFASCPGVSKVGSYTGNGSSQTINCGFAAGARFVMIKRTDSTGDWYVWDSARGIVAGNDPHLSLNDISAEVTTDDTVDTASSGFVVNQVSATNVNVNGATYIFLAIA